MKTHVWTVAAALLASGCSMLLQTAEPTQCRTDADCDADPVLHGRVCTAGFCVQKSPSPVSADGGSGCTSSKLCTQANSGQASLCKTQGGACTPLITDQCATIDGDWENPNAIFVGVMVPRTFKQSDGTRPPQPYGDRVVKAVQLGLMEFSAAFPSGVHIRDQDHPIAVLHCDTAGDPDTARAVFDHLTDVAGARALIVPFDEDVNAVAAKASAKESVIACADCTGALPTNALVWRISPPLAPEADVVAKRVADLESALNTGGKPTIKVFMVAEPGTGTTDLIDALATKVRFNGKSTADNQTAGKFKSIRTEDPRSTQPDHAAHIKEMIEFCPDVVVAAMSADLPRYYIPGIEKDWAATCGAQPPPSYVVTSLSRDNPNFFVDDFGAYPTLPARISGSRPFVDATLQRNADDYSRRYKLESNGKLPDGNEGSYDAFYSLVYAIAAASNRSVLDGPAISKGFESLISGPGVNVGPVPLSQTLPTLEFSPGATIDLVGAKSHLDWDIAKRDLKPSDMGTWCFRGDGTINDDAGLKYSPASGFSGTYSCN